MIWPRTRSFLGRATRGGPRFHWWWIAVIGLLLGPAETHAAAAPTLMLDETSPTVAAIGSVAGELLTPAAPPMPGPLASPFQSLSLSGLGLVFGDLPVTLSFGVDSIPSGILFFGVDRSARSTAGSFPPDVHTERSSGAAGDVYRSFFPPNHTLVFDGDGLEGGSPGSDGLGLDESASPIDDLVGLEMCAVGAVDPDLDGVLDQPVYFTLAAGSPTLATLGATPHDVLRSRIGASGAATLWLAGSALGLVGVTGVPLAVVARSVLVAVLLARIGVERTVVTPVRMGVVVGCEGGAGWP